MVEGFWRPRMNHSCIGDSACSHHDRLVMYQPLSIFLGNPENMDP